MMAPSDAPLPRKVGARAVVAGAGAAAAALPEQDGEHLWVSGVRGGGRLVLAGALGGVLYDLGIHLRDRFPSSRGIRPALVAGAATAGVALWANRRLTRRKREITRWPVAQQNTLPHAVATGALVTAAGMGLARGYVFTRDSLIGYLGPRPSKQVIARATNAALWALGATAAYHAGVGYIGRANEKVESGYATAPELSLVSGSPDSFSAFEHLGQQGRRYVTDIVTSELIEGVMDEPAVAQPIRTYVGFNSEPLYVTGRAEIALAELERTGAFDRSYLLLVAADGYRVGRPDDDREPRSSSPAATSPRAASSTAGTRRSSRSRRFRSGASSSGSCCGVSPSGSASARRSGAPRSSCSARASERGQAPT